MTRWTARLTGPLIAGLLLGGLASCGGGSEPPLRSATAQTRPPLILAIGDSIMAGYIPGEGMSQRLAQRESFLRELGALGHVIGNPVGGASTTLALNIQVPAATTPFDPALPALRPDVVVVMLGTNDAVGSQSREAAVNNVARILQSFPGAAKVLVSPPHWDARTDPWMAAWSRDLAALALVNGAVFVDVYSASLSHPGWQCTPTNLHPCEAAHRDIGALVAAATQRALHGN